MTRANGLECGQTDRDLYRTLHTGLTGSPMPSYSTAFLFGSEVGVNPSVISTRFGAEESKALPAYLRDQPSPAAIEVLPEASRQELVAKRTWALVRYLQSPQR